MKINTICDTDRTKAFDYLVEALNEENLVCDLVIALTDEEFALERSDNPKRAKYIKAFHKICKDEHYEILPGTTGYGLEEVKPSRTWPRIRVIQEDEDGDNQVTIMFSTF